MNDLVILNLKKIKDLMNDKPCNADQLIESLRKICIIIAVIMIKYET
jgi:hypothetical protein